MNTFRLEKRRLLHRHRALLIAAGKARTAVLKKYKIASRLHKQQWKVVRKGRALYSCILHANLKSRRAKEIHREFEHLTDQLTAFDDQVFPVTTEIQRLHTHIMVHSRQAEAQARFLLAANDMEDLRKYYMQTESWYILLARIKIEELAERWEIMDLLSQMEELYKEYVSILKKKFN